MKKASRLALSDLLEIAHMRGVEASVGGSGSPTASASAAASSASSGPMPGFAAAVGPPPLPPAVPEAAPQALPGAEDAQRHRPRSRHPPSRTQAPRGVPAPSSRKPRLACNHTRRHLGCLAAPCTSIAPQRCKP
jgi:hypothetical protein